MRKHKAFPSIPVDDATVRWALACRRKAIRAASLRALPAAAERHAVDAKVLDAIERVRVDRETPAHDSAIRSHTRSQRRLCRFLRGVVGEKIHGPLLDGDAQVFGVELEGRTVLLIATAACDVPVATALVTRADGSQQEIELRVASLPTGAITTMKV